MIETWGNAGDGTKVRRVEIGRDGMRARLISLGAALQDLRLEGHAPPLVLGYPNLDPYRKNTNYFGAIVGRYANRIAKASAIIDNRRHRFDRNFLGRHILHGGRDGSAARNWQLVDHGPRHAVFADTLPDGHMGFPGNLRVRVVYRIEPLHSLEIEISARTDATTPCNFAAHSYFNLDGQPGISQHWIKVHADRYLPSDTEGIPVSGPAPVSRTRFDLRTAQALCHGGTYASLDTNYCVSDKSGDLRPVALLGSRRSGLSLAVSSTEPGLQVYTGQAIAPDGPIGLTGRRYGPFAGVALEPQGWPDSPNHKEFPDTLLRSGQQYRQVSRYRISREQSL